MGCKPNSKLLFGSKKRKDSGLTGHGKHFASEDRWSFTWLACFSSSAGVSRQSQSQSLRSRRGTLTTSVSRKETSLVHVQHYKRMAGM